VTGERITITGARPLRGRLRLPGEKGISHRAVVVGAVARGDTRVRGLAPGDDVTRTSTAMVDLGVGIVVDGEATVISGSGFDGLRAPDGPIDCGNSGTTMRVLAGLLAGRPFSSRLTGDASLATRPMRRVVEPLRALGAHIDGADGGDRAPLDIRGTRLVGRRVELPVASGQVKTAMVLAGLQADGTTEIVEPRPSRDHTERMLVALGAPISRVSDRELRVERGEVDAFDLSVPGDPSSAAYFVVGALVTPGSELVLEGVALNQGRLGFVDALRAMGGAIDVVPRGEQLGEPVGDITVRSSRLQATTVVCQEAFIDEVPALAVAAAFAEGATEFCDAAELRVKESDRVVTTIGMLGALGIEADPRPDGLVVHGGAPRGGTVTSHGDHRIALAAAIAANGIAGTSIIEGWEAIAVSYPRFTEDLAIVTEPA
jgi:3-phosphoshikimate 1-carboxyvinyltransferase